VEPLDRPTNSAAPDWFDSDRQMQAETSGMDIIGEASWASGPHKSGHPGEERSQGEEAARPVLVRMQDVNVSYDGTEILRGVDWTVCQGENWALLGPNGSGKTTLLSLILADNPQAYANEILLFGKRRGSGESIWEIKQRIGWVAPELHLYYPRRVSCLGIVCSGFFDSVGLYRQCSPAQREMAGAWMQRLGMSQYADVAFAALSEGEQRMVLVARALVKRPTLLILDEPCQGLDADNRDRVLQIVNAVGDHTDTNIIYVTHNADELPRVITHVIRLDRGRIVQKARMYPPNPPRKAGSRDHLFATPTVGTRKDSK
jgi:molybdate transport system ATP-binding protein